MNEPHVEDLLHRIESLEREKRRWKLIGISSLSVLLVLLVLGGVFSVGTAFMVRAQHIAAEQAREAAIQERNAAERARWGAEQRAKKKAMEDGR